MSLLPASAENVVFFPLFPRLGGSVPFLFKNTSENQVFETPVSHSFSLCHIGNTVQIL